MREEWHDKLGSGIDPFKGLTDPEAVDEVRIKAELGYIPDKSLWGNLVFGRGACDQLAGIVSQVYATKILLETRELGSLKGCHVISVATIGEEDNEGMAPSHILRSSHLERHQVPDAVVLTEPTGDVECGPCPINIGQRGRCTVELEVIGTSSHGSLPDLGTNALEHASLIVAEAAEHARAAFGDNKFMGKGSRTAVKCDLESCSGCSVPAKTVVWFDRRLTVGEDADIAIQEIKDLRSVARAIQAGCQVNVSVPDYSERNYKGIAVQNPLVYRGWITKPSDPAVAAAVESYKRVVSPHVPEVRSPKFDDLRKAPKIHRWRSSNDGVGYLLKIGTFQFSLEGKNWTEAGDFVHPPMFGIGAGYEQHAHKVGEYVHKDHLWCPIAVIARFPSVFVQHRAGVPE
jgi:putative selenium metabolism hydrolase